MNNDPSLHHVGIVFPDEDDALMTMQILGLREDYRGFVAHWSALCIFTKVALGSPIEFVIPQGGPLERFNKGAGGLHHIALEVRDLRQFGLDLEARGMKLLEAEPIKGAGSFLCNFLRPEYTRGLIVEFVQCLE